MSPTIDIKITAKSVRSRYAYLFDSVAELCRARYGEKPSTKFDDIRAATERLRGDDYLNDYLYSNLKALYDLYPTMLPVNQDQDKLDRLFELLGIVIGDVCAEVSEVMEEIAEHDREILIKKLLG